MPCDALDLANHNEGLAKLIEAKGFRYPFHIKSDSCDCWTCLLIRKKEPVKKYVPFDLNDPEVRKSLRGRWIKADCGEYQISGFRSIDGEDGEEWEVAVAFGVISSKNLFDRWTFEDGSKCGKLVEEE